MLAVSLGVLCLIRLYTDATEYASEVATEFSTEYPTNFAKESETSSVGFWVEFNRTITFRPTNNPYDKPYTKKCPGHFFLPSNCCPEERDCCGSSCCSNSTDSNRPNEYPQGPCD